MQSCERCNIRIQGNKHCCPLCGGLLCGMPGERVYPKIKRRVSKFSLVKISAFICILIELAMGSIAASIESMPAWCLFIMGAALIVWLDIVFAFYSRNNIMLLVSMQTYFGMGAAVYVDYLTGAHGWAAAWMLPFCFPGLAFAIIGIGKGMKLLLSDYIVFLEVDLLLSIAVQTVLIQKHMNAFHPPAIISCAILIAMGAAALLFWSREVRAAAEKMFHV